jgi:hypothetical protein
MVIAEYEKSTLIKKLLKAKKRQKPLRIAFLDIDATMTGSTQTTNKTRRELERLGYAVVYVTSRTEEMLMTSEVYMASRDNGFDRPVPHLGLRNEKHIYIPTENVEPEGILNPDAIAGSTGTHILLKQEDNSYQCDFTYNNMLQTDPRTWREQTMHFV